MIEEKSVKLRVSGSTEGGITTRIKVRNSPEFFIDESENLGGANANEKPNPLKALLGALAGCASVIAFYVSKEQNSTYNSLEFSVEGTFDPRGFSGVLSVRTYFQTVVLKNAVDTNESDEALEKLAAEVEKRCPVYNMMKDAGVEVLSQWVKKA